MRKFANVTTLRQLLHTKGHLEPDDIARAMAIVRALAIVDALANYDTKTKLGTHTLKYTTDTMDLQDIYNEVLAIYCWHFRSTTTSAIPVLRVLLRYQHDTHCHSMLK